MSDTRHIDMANALERLAAFVRDNPDLAHDLRFAFDKVYVPISDGTHQVARLAAFARAGKVAGAEVAKGFDDNWASLNITFGERVVVYVYAGRSQVCHRKVVGTRPVEKQVPDPNAPKVTVTVDEEVVEWECSPLLADGEDVPEQRVPEEVPF